MNRYSSSLLLPNYTLFQVKSQCKCYWKSSATDFLATMRIYSLVIGSKREGERQHGDTECPKNTGKPYVQMDIYFLIRE